MSSPVNDHAGPSVKPCKTVSMATMSALNRESAAIMSFPIAAHCAPCPLNMKYRFVEFVDIWVPCSVSMMAPFCNIE